MEAVLNISTDPPLAIMKSGCTLPAPSKDASRSLEQYRVRKQLYKGQTSMVLAATDRQTGAHVVLKVYSKRLVDKVERSQLEREMNIHGSLKHEHIIDLITVFEDDRAVYLVQSYAQGGDLFSALHALGRFDESRAAGTIIAPLLSALDYIHGKGIIHRDIKIENILLDQHGEVKLADFGLAIDCHDARPRSRLGTWEYMAPEVHLCPFKGSEEYADATATYSSSVDVWSVGVLAFELLVGKAPFQQDGDGICYEDLMSRDLLFPDSLSPEACSFIRSALCKQARHRPSARQLLRHRWLRPFLKAELLEDDAVPPPPAARSRGTRSLPLEVLHEVEPVPAETDADAGAAIEFVRRTPVNPSARGTACSAHPPPKTGAASSAGGLFAAPSKLPNPAASPATPLSCTSSGRTSEESSARCSAASACPSPGPLQPPSRGGSGSLAAATAGLLRKLPSKIQSLMNLNLSLGGRASRAENQVLPILAASLPSSPSTKAPAGLAPAKGSRSSCDCGSQGAGMSAGAAAWAEASKPTGRCSSVCCTADEARGRLLHSAAGQVKSSPLPLASGPSAHEAKAEGWNFARLVGRLGRRSVESLVPHSSAAATPDLSWQRPLQLPPHSGPAHRGVPAVPASQPEARQGPVRRSLSDRDLGARLALARQEPAAQTLEPTPPSFESRGSGRSRHMHVRARMRSVTCSDLQLQLLLGSEDRLWSVDSSSASPHRSSGVNIPGSAESNVCVSGSGVQLQGAAPGMAAPAMARDDGVCAAWLSSPQASGGESSLPSLPSPGARASEAGQPLRGSNRSRARRLYLLPPGSAYY